MSFYDIKITGKDVRRFIYNLSKRNIELYNIVFKDDYVIIKVSERDYIKITDIKTIYEIEIVGYYGLSKIRKFINNYYIFLIVLGIGFILFLGLTNVIFEVEVVHSDSKLRELILNELESKGISKYHFVVSYEKKEKIKEEIINRYKDKIEWMEIIRYGTKYEIKVEERKNKADILDDTPKDIVAKKNGLIKKIIASKGEIVSKKDQYVKKGDILISGSIHNKDTVVDRVQANGYVYAETWYTVTVELPYHYYEEINTNNSQKILEIRWFNNYYNLFDFKRYKYKKNNYLYKLKNMILPISFSWVKEDEIDIIDKVYTNDNALIQASKLARNHLYKKLGKDIDILFEKNLKITEENSKIVVVMFYKLYEDIAEYQDIKEENVVGN